MSSPPAPDFPVRRPRRPSPRKHEAILAAAVTCFADNGFAATSMDSIAAVADVSKQTVYHHFGNKNALFEAVIGRVSETMNRPLLDVHTRDLGPKKTLTVFGRHILEFLLSRQSLAFMRLIIAEAPKFEGLADMVIRAGMEGTIQAFARYVEDETANGHLAVDEPRRAAIMFFGMLVGDYRFRGLLGMLPDLPAAEMDAHVGAVVDVFLKAYGPAAG
jgi:AcrR family transcriptional regulator